MTAQIIDGKEVAHSLMENIKKGVQELEKKPCLAIILVGNDPASKLYVGKKEKACGEVGITCERYDLAEDTQENDILKLVEELNNNGKVDGILLQLPLPKPLNEKLITDMINPKKDVDGLTSLSAGNTTLGKEGFQPATPKGIIHLIQSMGEPLEGKHVVVVGRSSIVGKPVAMMLLEKHATVTVCHSKTHNLKEHTQKADILVVAAGKSHLINGEMVKEGAIVIDAGTNKTPEGLVGDVDFDSVKEKAGFITPVPGGVGPMTIVMLLQNVVDAARLRNKNN